MLRQCNICEKSGVGCGEGRAAGEQREKKKTEIESHGLGPYTTPRVSSLGGKRAVASSERLWANASVQTLSEAPTARCPPVHVVRARAGGFGGRGRFLFRGGSGECGIDRGGFERMDAVIVGRSISPDRSCA